MRRIVESGTRPSRFSDAFELSRLELRQQANGTIEQANEDEEGGEPVAQRGELRIVRERPGCCRGLGHLLLEDGDDRIPFAHLALGDDPAEPLPVIPDSKVGGSRRAAASHAARFGHPFDDAPRFGLGQGKAGGTVAQAERLADLAFRQRLLARHEVCLHPGDRRRHAPGGAHLAPCLGQVQPDRLGGGRGRAGRIAMTVGREARWLGHSAVSVARDRLRATCQYHVFGLDQGTRRSAPSMPLTAAKSGASGSISTSHDEIRSGPAGVAKV